MWERCHTAKPIIVDESHNHFLSVFWLKVNVSALLIPSLVLWEKAWPSLKSLFWSDSFRNPQFCLFTSASFLSVCSIPNRFCAGKRWNTNLNLFYKLCMYKNTFKNKLLTAFIYPVKLIGFIVFTCVKKYIVVVNKLRFLLRGYDFNVIPFSFCHFHESDAYFYCFCTCPIIWWTNKHINT